MKLTNLTLNNKWIFISIIIILTIIVISYLVNKSDLVNKSENKIKEGFVTYNNWTPELIQQFRKYQATVNENNHQFNMEQVQKQATPEEAKELLKTGYWPWSNSLIALYLNKIGNNNILKIDPGVALNYDMKLYNQKAATELLSWNTKEGEFLLNGVDLGINKAMDYTYFTASLPHDTIKCTTLNDGTTSMTKVEHTGINRWNGYTNKKITNLSNAELPNEIPGFSFVKGECNPCVALNNPADYSCPFEINVKNDSDKKGITYIWRQLWGLN